MSFYARPTPPTADAEVARIDNDLRVYVHRLKTVALTEPQLVTLWSVIDGLLGRRHKLTEGKS